MNEVKVGDIVEVVKNESFHDFNIGEKVRVLKVYTDREERLKAEQLNGLDYWYLNDGEFVVVKEEK